MPRPRFRTLAHGADARVAVWGANQEELIGNAVRAAMTMTLGRTPRGRSRRRFPVHPWPPDLSSRLVQAVNEALYLLYACGEVATGFELGPFEAHLLTAPLPARQGLALEVKAATRHDLRPAHRAGRLVAVLTLDI